MRAVAIALFFTLVGQEDASRTPAPSEMSEPFVESVQPLREWRGEGEGDAFGWIVRNVGDVDGDRIADVATSAPGWGEDAGKVYVFSTRSGDLLWSVSGDPGVRLGLGLEAAGDANGDGTPDVAAGAPGADRVFVYSGRDGAVVLALEAEQPGEIFGRKIGDVGDLDEDGYDDVIVGAPGNDERGEDAGRAAVYSGKTGAVLLSWYGESPGDRFGSAVAGRVDGDATRLVVGAPDAGEDDRGRAYVYGRDGELAFAIEAGLRDRELGGMFVSIAGDLDGDGVGDVYASDFAGHGNGEGSGRVYVHSGARGRRLLTISGEAAGDGFGTGTGDAGDVDRDGRDDLVVGAWQHGAAAPGGGKVYLFSGRDGELLRAWTAKLEGETLGFDATGLGDVDGDGRVDLLVSSGWSPVNGERSGRVFVLSSR